MNFLAIGAPDESGYQGKTYLYKRDSNGSYAYSESHSPQSPQADDSFGWAVAMDASSMLVASLQRGNSGSGKVSSLPEEPG